MAEEEERVILFRGSDARHFMPLKQRMAFSVGHVLNDLCAAIWFSYLLVYMHYVNKFHSTVAGVLLLIGQIADAIATPFVGIESDKDHDWWLCKYGRRKSWHLFGTICVLISFPFLFNKCITCESSHETAQVVYYSAFIIIFQIGWASVQISHLSLIPDLTPYSCERVELNAWRYAFTVGSNIAVYVITWSVFQIEGKDSADEEQITPSDANVFRNLVFIVMGIGFLFSCIFHFGVKEKPRGRTASNLVNGLYDDSVDFSSPQTHLKWRNWLKESQFYKVGLLYMGTRLCLNLTQVYTPLFLQDSLHLKKDSIAYIPLVIYGSGFVSSFLMKYLNVHIGKKITYLIGSSLSLVSCTWLYFGTYESFKSYGIYGVAVLLGISGSTMLITSLSITNDLIGHNTSSGAFVFGAMSFLDKLSNGIAVIVIENLHPCKTCGCTICDNYYRNVLTFVCGGAVVLSLLALALLAPHEIGITRSPTTRNGHIRATNVETEDEDDCDLDIPESPLIKNRNGLAVN